MKVNLTGFSLALFLAVVPTASASTTWYVDGVNGNDGNNCKSSTTACKTIGHTISLASSGDSVSVAAATYVERLTINISLHVTGSGAATTIIDGGGINTVVTISNTQASVTLSKLTIRNGVARAFFGGLGEGGGIFNLGKLTVSNSTISGNEVIRGSCANVCTLRGGGIFNVGTLTINNSTISGNSANFDIICGNMSYCTAIGGGLYNGGTLTVSNSTITGNTDICSGEFCTNDGAGIKAASGTVEINNTTISGNSGARYGGGISNCCVTVATVILQNSIVASNSGGNCFGTMTSNGYDLSSDDTCNFNGPGDLNNTDPKLGPLKNNGGPTQTQALLSGSPAIDAGNPNGCTDGRGRLLKTDQRGAPRPDKEDTAGCDMGAYESQSDLDVSSPATNSKEGDLLAEPSPFCFRNCRHYGYCEVQWVNGQWQTDGRCTSHNQVGFCDVQTSSNCPNGKPPLRFSLTTCGGLASDTVDLARSCSF